MAIAISSNNIKLLCFAFLLRRWNQTLLIRLKIAPPWLQFIMECPHSLSRDIRIKSLIDALAHLSNLIMRESSRVDRALSIDWCEWIRAIRAQSVGLTIKVYCEVSFKIWLWTVDPLAAIWNTSIIEASKPECTSVCGQRPFSDPNLVLVLGHLLHVLFVSLAYLLYASVVLNRVPCPVEMIVDYYVVRVIICEQVIPGRRI